MIDFYTIKVSESTDPRSKFTHEIMVDFIYRNVKDIVIKGGEFRGFWDGERWSQDIDDLIGLIDADVMRKVDEIKQTNPGARVKFGLMNYESSGIMQRFVNYMKKSATSTVQFNSEILFSDVTPVREHYSTYQLPYTPQPGPTKAFEELTGVLYAQEELDKILWAMGALFTGEIKRIEKFLYLYGPKGTGKGTILKVLGRLIGEYQASVDLQAMTGNSEFATADIKEVPVLIDSDSDISKITKEQNLLKLTSHEPILIRKLYKPAYPVVFNGLLITASNERYKVKNIDSGITRRALVVHPTGDKISLNKYQELMRAIEFEVPAIAQLCIDKFNELGPEHYQHDVDVDMIAYGDRIFDFVRENVALLSNNITLKQATELYKNYLDDLGWSTTSAKRDLRLGLQRYYEEFIKDTNDPNGNRVRDYFRGFKWDVAFPEQIGVQKVQEEKLTAKQILTCREPGMFDVEAKDWPAQYANDDGFPRYKWDNVRTTLKDLDPRKLHYVRTPLNHIVIDFDIKDEDGLKDIDMNIAKASMYPETYMETSKSGGGIHLHYWYDGDVGKLAPIIEPGVEVKVFNGNSSLRRKFIRSNDKPIARISSGLPFKEEEKKMYVEVEDLVWDEAKLRSFVRNCLAKEHHGATKPEIDFLKHTLDKAAESGAQYDISDMHDMVLRFAMRSSNNPSYCLQQVARMQFSTLPEETDFTKGAVIIPNEDIWFYDIEVYPNLLIICAKRYGFEVDAKFLDHLSSSTDIFQTIAAWSDYIEANKEQFRILVNPSPNEVEALMRKPMAGFNNRKYDNHIVYNAMMGNTNHELYLQSQQLVTTNSGTVGMAYNISYIDIYEMMAIKQSLKKWEIQLGLPHDEFEFPWDQPLDTSNWARAVRYCLNDVMATEGVFRSKDGVESYNARLLLCELTDMPVNTKTQKLAAKFLFGDEKRPQDKFHYYHLSEEFPGYEFNMGKSSYLGKDPSEGGYVSSKPGIYQNVLYIDVASMHPWSLINANYFGEYTPRFKALVESRLFIKRGKMDEARHAFDAFDPTVSEKLGAFLQSPEQADGLGYAMKIVINMIYGMTSASYDNEFRHPDNKDNIVAKRGALFMMTLEQELENRGVSVVHVKTDSMKLVNWTDEDVAFVHEFAAKYGYQFEIECIFDRMALVNKSTLIGEFTDKNGNKHWEAVGAQFAEPYVYKKLFSQEPVEEDDFFITKSVKSTIYIGDTFVGKNAEIYASLTGEDIYAIRPVDVAPSVLTRYDKEKFLPKRDIDGRTDAEIHEAKIARICKETDLPAEVVEEIVATRPRKGYIYDKRFTVTGTSGYKWKLRGNYAGKEDVDMVYYRQLAIDAVNDISKVGDANIMFHDNLEAQKLQVL